MKDIKAMKSGSISALFLAFVISAFSASAQDISKKDYILGNTLLTLYHEFGHGLVSELGLPVLGKEEDAVDTFSIVAITDKLNDADAYTDAQAEELDTYLWVTANAWLTFADEEEPDESSYAGEHSLDIQRFYSHVCLVYGSDTDFHAPLITDLDIDAELMEGCEERFEIAYDNWQLMLEEDEEGAGKKAQISIEIQNSKSAKHRKYAKWLKSWPWLSDFEETMEGLVSLPYPILISFKSCDDENAYWDPIEREVSFCYELMDLYADFYDAG